MDQQWIICLLIVCIHLSQQMSTPYSPTYRAAVVEYPPKYFTDSRETLRVNSDAYVKHIKTANISDADIIVFPEDGLTTVSLPEREAMQDWTTIIPAASDNYTPCIQNTIEVSEALKKISCAARENQIYVVINIAEKLPCTENVCPKDNVFYYNSNVVFDRTGKIIARYRKTNLFLERQFNVTTAPELITFHTDFGVKFGTFICFDILFQQPTLQLTRSLNVTDIVYPTAWFSETPFLTAVQTQSGWSFSEDVNLLAAGYDRPGHGNAGSGIYLGRKGIGTAIMPKTTHEEVLIFEVPKIKKTTSNKNHQDHSQYHDQKVSLDHHLEHVHDELRKKREGNTMTDNNTIFLSHENIHVYETVPLEENVSQKTVCQNGFCCDFKVEIVNIDPSTKYRLITFSGTRRYGVVEADVRACGVIQCSNDSISSCGSVQESGTIFSNIQIMATFHLNNDILVMPSTLNRDLFPLRDWTYREHAHDDHVHISMSLDKNTKNLVTFGLYSRFNKNNTNKASFDAINYLITLIITLLLSRL